MPWLSSLACLLTILFCSTLTISSFTSPLQKRARFSHWSNGLSDGNAILVGLPNDQPECLRMYGRPLLSDCETALDLLKPVGELNSPPTSPQSTAILDVYHLSQNAPTTVGGTSE